MNDATDVIRRIDKAYPKAGALVPVSFTHEECDEVVLALRVLRVLLRADHSEATITIGRSGIDREQHYVYDLHLGESIDDAERLLGIGGAE